MGLSGLDWRNILENKDRIVKEISTFSIRNLEKIFQKNLEKIFQNFF